MSNRILSIIMLLGTFLVFYGVYYYLFVLNVGTIVINSNVSGYKVELKNDKIKIPFVADCSNEVCNLDNIAPLFYNLTITKDNYKTYTTNISLKRQENLSIRVNLEKQLIIEKITNNQTQKETTTDTILDYESEENIELKQNLEDTLKDDTQDSIRRAELLAKARNDSFLRNRYIYFDLGDLGYFYFDENSNNTLTLYRRLGQIDTKVMDIKKVPKNELKLDRVYHTDDYIYIYYGDMKGLYNLSTGKLTNLEFFIDIKYIKKDSNIFTIITDKGSFLYNINTNKTEFFYLFKDFIYFDENNYFGIIFKDELDKKRNYNLENEKDNIIIKYNFNNRDFKLLDSTPIDIIKILKQGDSVYFFDKNGNKYLVRNF